MESVTVERLAALAARALAPPPFIDMSHVAPIRVSLAEAMEFVRAGLSVNGAASFRELLADNPERIHVVVRFLALLEFHRQGKVELSQARLFGEIEVRWHGEMNPAVEVDAPPEGMLVSIEDADDLRIVAPEVSRVLEALLFLADEPMTAASLGLVVERPRAEVEGMLGDLAAIVRPASLGPDPPAGRGRMATVHPSGRRDLRRAVRPVVPPRQADEGCPRDALHRRLQAARDPASDLQHPGGELGRGAAGPRRARTGP